MGGHTAEGVACGPAEAPPEILAAISGDLLAMHSVEGDVCQ
jgi:hypothetical protein